MQSDGKNVDLYSEPKGKVCHVEFILCHISKSEGKNHIISGWGVATAGKENCFFVPGSSWGRVMRALCQQQLQSLL